MRGKLLISRHHLMLRGTGDEIREVLSWLPPTQFMDVQRFSENYTGSTRGDWLERLPHVFPELCTVELIGNDVEPGGWDMGSLAPLAQLSNLTSLALHCPQLALTTKRLTRMCNSLPALHTLYLGATLTGVNRDRILTEFKKLGREVEVHTPTAYVE